MKIKNIISMIFILLICIAILSLEYLGTTILSSADSVYQIYLDGKIIGCIQDKDEFYSIINKHQMEAKEKYGVDNVYPPDNLKIVKVNKYNPVMYSAEEIYEKIASLDSFTVDGYVISIKNGESDFKLYVLDKKVFEDSLQEFVYAFVDVEDYDNYINNTQPKIETTGKIIENMYFDETITIKKGLIGINEKIYTTDTDLSQFLLFGSNSSIKTYTVKMGDTIESISDANKLNVQEFLIANANYSSVDSLLTIGDKVNITLINPQITLTYDVTEVSDTEIAFSKKSVFDNSKPSNYSEITTPGVKGITRVTQSYSVTNGEQNSGVQITNQEVIVDKVDQVTTIGRPSQGGKYIQSEDDWLWPTNVPYVITSYYSYRWGKMHEGLDISGTGYGSPIYSVLDGEVVAAKWGACGDSGGCCVIVKHSNGYYSMYAHMKCVNDNKYCRAAGQCNLFVQPGDKIERGYVIGQMGQTGFATGTHLHFSIFFGSPYTGGSYTINPLLVWNRK